MAKSNLKKRKLRKNYSKKRSYKRKSINKRSYKRKTSKKQKKQRGGAGPSPRLFGRRRLPQPSMFTLKLGDKNVTMFEQLGSGQFGTIFKLITRERNFALKFLKIKKDFNHEVDILTVIRDAKPSNNNIYKFYGSNQPLSLLVFELMGGDLKQYLEKTGDISKKNFKTLLKHIASGLDFLKNKSIAHLDLRACNILTQLLHPPRAAAPRLKISDFGLSQHEKFFNANEILGFPLLWHHPNYIYGVTDECAPDELYPTLFDPNDDNGWKGVLHWFNETWEQSGTDTDHEAAKRNFIKHAMFNDRWSFICVIAEILSRGNKPYYTIGVGNAPPAAFEDRFRLINLDYLYNTDATAATAATNRFNNGPWEQKEYYNLFVKHIMNLQPGPNAYTKAVEAIFKEMDSLSKFTKITRNPTALLPTTPLVRSPHGSTPGEPGGDPQPLFASAFVVNATDTATANAADRLATYTSRPDQSTSEETQVANMYAPWKLFAQNDPDAADADANPQAAAMPAAAPGFQVYSCIAGLKMFNAKGELVGSDDVTPILSDGDAAARLFSGNLNQEPPPPNQANLSGLPDQHRNISDSDEQAHIVAVKKIHRHISDPVRPGERYLHSLEEETPTEGLVPMPSFGLPPQSGPLLGGFSTFPLGLVCGPRRRISVPTLFKGTGVAAAAPRRSASASASEEPGN